MAVGKWEYVDASQMIEPRKGAQYLDLEGLSAHPTEREKEVGEEGRILALIQHIHDMLGDEGDAIIHRFVDRSSMRDRETLALVARTLESAPTPQMEEIAWNFAKEKLLLLLKGTTALQADLTEKVRDDLNHAIDVPKRQPQRPTVVIEAQAKKLTVAERFAGSTTVFHERVITDES